MAADRQAHAWRLRVPEGVEQFEDRWLGTQLQEVAKSVGDFVLKRTDGLWAYQLAVVVDDDAQGIKDVVRGKELLSSTARQRVLARRLGLPMVRVMHVPLLLDPVSGFKLSKQNAAPAIDTTKPLAALMQAWQALGFASFKADTISAFLIQAAAYWAARFKITTHA